MGFALRGSKQREMQEIKALGPGVPLHLCEDKIVKNAEERLKTLLGRELNEGIRVVFVKEMPKFKKDVPALAHKGTIYLCKDSPRISISNLDDVAMHELTHAEDEIGSSNLSTQVKILEGTIKNERRVIRNTVLRDLIEGRATIVSGSPKIAGISSEFGQTSSLLTYASSVMLVGSLSSLFFIPPIMSPLAIFGAIFGVGGLCASGFSFRSNKNPYRAGLQFMEFVAEKAGSLKKALQITETYLPKNTREMRYPVLYWKRVNKELNQSGESPQHVS